MELWVSKKLGAINRNIIWNRHHNFCQREPLLFLSYGRVNLKLYLDKATNNSLVLGSEKEMPIEQKGQETDKKFLFISTSWFWSS